MNRLSKIAFASALALSAPAVAAPVILHPAMKLQLAPRPMNADATIAKIRPRLTPWGAQWARNEAQKLGSGQISSDTVTSDARSACGAQSACFDFANMPIEDAMMLMMFLVNSDAEQDMRDQLADMERERQKKQALRSVAAQMRAQRQAMDQQLHDAQDSKDSLDDLSPEDQLKLQMLMDRRQRALETMSNILKKIDETDDSIIKNMK